jgi:hypothetical protein
VFLFAALGLGARLAQETPRINADGVIPKPAGRLSSARQAGDRSLIYGRHLGPENACSAGAAGSSDVRDLCGISVTVGGVQGALLHVEEKQINLRVPFNVPAEGMVPFVVTREGLASAAVSQQFGPYRAAIRVPGIASEDMPLWIEVQLPDPLSHSLWKAEASRRLLGQLVAPRGRCAGRRRFACDGSAKRPAASVSSPGRLRRPL